MVNFSRGFAWAVVALASLFFFLTALPFGFLGALAISFVVFFIGLLIVGFFEILALLLEIYKEQKTQTHLLEQQHCFNNHQE